jgi:hypothetical protein
LIQNFLEEEGWMKRTASVLAFLFVLGWFSYSYATLYDAWVSCTSVYLGGNVYQNTFTWGASSTLSQEGIDNLFPYETGPYSGNGSYERTSSGIGTPGLGFDIWWDNPVDIVSVSTGGTNFASDTRNQTGLYLGDFLRDWWSVRQWNRSRGFSFTTKGYTGNQNIVLSMDYFGDYRLVSGYDRPFLCNMYGAPLQVARTFAPIPEPATVLLLGSGLLIWLFSVRPRMRKRTGA